MMEGSLFEVHLMLFTNSSAHILLDRQALKAALGLRKSDRTPTTKLRARYLTECCTITAPDAPTAPDTLGAGIVLVALLVALLVVWEVVVVPVFTFTCHSLAVVVRQVHTLVTTRFRDNR